MPGVDSNQLREFTKARSSYEYFATNDSFIDQDYYGENGLIVKEFHQEWVDAVENYKRTAITAFTGSGKSTILGVTYPLWRIFKNPGEHVLIVADSMDQSYKILAEIKHHLQSSEYFNELIDKDLDWNKKEIELTNGSKIFCRPFTEKIKSVHVDYILVDEAAEGDEEIYERYVKTRAARKDGDICLISTPVHENDLMAKLSDGVEQGRCPECNSMVVKDSDGKMICPSSGCDDTVVDPVINESISEKGYWNGKFAIMDLETEEPTFPEAFDESDIARLRHENPEAFQREYLCESLAVEGDLFDPNSIMDCYDKEESFSQVARDDCTYYLGCDFAVSKKGDYSVFTVLEQSPEREGVVIRHMERIRGQPLPAQEDRIRDLHEIFNFRRILVDETNFGHTVLRTLKEDTLPARGQSFEQKARNNLLIGLKTKIEQEKIIIPRGGDGMTQNLTDTLYNELLGFGTSVTEAGTISYTSTAKHDDTVMSLAMASAAVQDSRDVLTEIAFR